ncbi:MAG: hypothetical protein E6K68_03515 [Nitrospirae bacterium]|nr:MAG: hypothetical protein E6K68_03515 [Nitrospirota bacterium]
MSGVIYAEDRAERIWQKLRAVHPGQEVPQAFLTFEPVSFIPDLNMVAQVFPYDRRLPTLPIVMTRPSPDLEHRFFAWLGPGDWYATVWNVQPIRYRAGARAVLLYEAEIQDAVTGRREKRRFYVKVYRGDEGEQTNQVLQALWKRAEAGGDGFTVGRPVAYLPGLHALLQEESPGTTLAELLLQDRSTSLAARRIARALAIFNQDGVAATRRHSREDEISELKWVGDLLQWACPHLAAEIDRIIGAVVAGLEEVPSGPTHRDLTPDHILLEGDRLALIDLDSFAEADPVLDAATFLAHLCSMPLRFPVTHDRVQLATRAFAEEYFSHVPRAWRGRLPLHYAGAALKAAVGFFRRQEPRWSEKIAALVKEARDSLDGRLW